MIPHKKQDCPPSEPKELRYGVLFADRKSKQIVIASMDGRAAVFVLQWAANYPMYSLYEDGLSSGDADIILNHIAANETVKARTWFRHHFDDSKPQCRNVGEIRLGDTVSDWWFDAWKHMQGVITNPMSSQFVEETVVEADYS